MTEPEIVIVGTGPVTITPPSGAAARVMRKEREFYNARPRFETRPEDDPAMTVRCESWDRRYDPTVGRVIKNDAPRRDGYVWLHVSGNFSMPLAVANHDDVRSWPVVHPLTYTTAFRHTQTREALERGAAGQLEGDMGVEAFRGEAPD